MPRLIGWKFEYWKQVDEHSYTTIIPITSMVNHSIRTFKNAVTRLKKSDDPLNKMKSEIKDATNIIKCLDYWGKPDSINYAKVSSFIINTFYKKDVKYILNLK